MAETRAHYELDIVDYAVKVFAESGYGMGSFQGPESGADSKKFGDCAGYVGCVLGDLANKLGEVGRGILCRVGELLKTHDDRVSAGGRIGQWRAEEDS